MKNKREDYLVGGLTKIGVIRMLITPISTKEYKWIINLMTITLWLL